MHCRAAEGGAQNGYDEDFHLVDHFNHKGTKTLTV